MKSFYLTIIISILSINTFSQIYFNKHHIPQEVWNNPDKMGQDTNEYFNDYELEYFSNLFKNANINLNKKHITFIKSCGQKSIKPQLCNAKNYPNGKNPRQQKREFYYPFGIAKQM